MKGIKTFIALIILLTITFQSSAQFCDLIELRKLCAKAYYNNDPTELINKLEALNQNNIPLLTGYKSMALMLQSKKSISPIDKINYFRKGKELLEHSIYSDAACIELRYLRFCVQTSLPFFLGYKSEIESDKNLIALKWSSLNDFDLKKRIREFMVSSVYCTEAEKNIFKNG